tara:strand:+ start:288 stop:476 length:189 start_codon:yes stop_codon:yes gene_type:complete
MIRQKLNGAKKRNSPTTKHNKVTRDSGGRHCFSFKEQIHNPKIRKIERIENGITYFIGGGCA